MVEERNGPAEVDEAEEIEDSISDLNNTPNNTNTQGIIQILREKAGEDVEPWHEPVDGKEVLDLILRSVNCHLDIRPEEAVAITLWIAFTHAFDVAEISPRLLFVSPAPESGKTTGLKLLACLVQRPAASSQMSQATIYRVINQCRPTLLVDEADTY